jgi:sulfur carrier protein ThiS
MRVQVKLFGTLRRLSRPGTPGLWTGDIPERSTIRDLLAILGTSDKELAAASINGELVDLDAPILRDAQVTMVTPVGGG